MSAAPAIPWLDSNAVRSLLITMVLALLTWTGDSLNSGAWSFKALALAELPIIAMFLQQLSRSDVKAPAVANAMTFGLLNARNPK